MQERATGNRLGEETSPYLLQHKDNPVHWRAWGEAALAEARATGKPILLSVGYAACHWCHVMAHESFEDAATAEVMNELFVNIKVDREERPDVDAIYMGALHELGEQGGWPLTMFLTSDAEPFWGGTYFPKEQRYGRPGFVSVLNEVARIYRDEPDKVRTNADVLKDRLKPGHRVSASDPPSEVMLADLGRRMVQAIDPVNGGIRGAPKFPQPQFLSFLWRSGIRYGLANPLEAVNLTLTHIAQGGIYDHLGGGFSRYSVDERWLVPHFEKMLYDNAQLIELMTEAWRESKSKLFAQRVAETVDWLLREMRSEGAFAASLDADSEGEEGKFYVWSLAEIQKLLGETDAKLLAEIYGVTEEGNFEGHNILNRLGSIEFRDEETENRLAELRKTLFERRKGRIRPGFDDKVLADWNGLMIAALANAAEVFDQPEWLAAAEAAFAFVCTKMMSRRAAVSCLSCRRGQGAGHRQRLRQHDPRGARACQRYGQAQLCRAGARLGRCARQALLGVGHRRLLFRRRRYLRSHRAPLERAGRSNAERQWRDGVEPDGAFSVDWRGALRQARRGGADGLRRRHAAERVGPCRSARIRARCCGTYARRADRA